MKTENSEIKNEKNEGEQKNNTSTGSVSDTRKMSFPFSEKDVMSLHSGDKILISGKIFTGRDTLHHYVVEEGNDLPKDIFLDPEHWFYETSPTEWYRIAIQESDENSLTEISSSITKIFFFIILNP